MHDCSFANNMTVGEITMILGMNTYRLPGEYDCQWNILFLDNPEDVFETKDIVKSPVILNDSVVGMLNQTDSILNEKLLSSSVLISLCEVSRCDLITNYIDHRNASSTTAFVPYKFIVLSLQKANACKVLNGNAILLGQVRYIKAHDRRTKRKSANRIQEKTVVAYLGYIDYKDINE